METNQTQKTDIKNIFLVLGLAIVCAGLLTAFFLHYYGPSGRYTTSQLLLSPKIIERINYIDKHPRTGQKAHFMFDRNTLSYFDSQQGKVVQRDVSLENYERIYELIKSDKSLEKVPEETLKNFHLSYPLTLVTHTRVAEQNGSVQLFQILQVSEQGDYRLQINENKSQSEWVYFSHPGIHQKIIHLSNP